MNNSDNNCSSSNDDNSGEDGEDFNLTFLSSSLESSANELSLGFKQAIEGLQGISEEAELVDQEFASQVETQLREFTQLKRQFTDFTNKVGHLQGHASGLDVEM